MAITEPKVFFLSDEGEDERPDIDFIVKYQRKVPKGEAPPPRSKQPAYDWKDEEDTFTAYGEVPSGLIMTTLASFTRGGAEGSAGVLTFLRSALVEKDVDRFMELINDKDVRVHMKNLAAITDWLMTEYGERPTESA